MEANTIVVITLVALVALVVIGLVFWSGRRQRTEVSASREQLEQHRRRAESLDPGTTRRRQSEVR